MISITYAFLISMLIGVIPIYFGIILSRTIMKRVDSSRIYLIALSTGILSATFIDLILNSSYLGINLGIERMAMQILFIGSFFFGLIILGVIKDFYIDNKIKNTTKNEYLIYLVAIGLCFHVFAEGIVIGYSFKSSVFEINSNTITQGTSFFLHKIGEGIIIPIIFSARRKTVILAGLLTSLPIGGGTIIAMLGLKGIFSSIFFAIGAGTTLYLLLMYSALIDLETNRNMKIILVFSGFLFMYLAGVIHSF